MDNKQPFGLSSYDDKLIVDIIEGYSNESPLQILKHLKRIFAHDMTENHLITFGLKLGEYRSINEVQKFNLTLQ